MAVCVVVFLEKVKINQRDTDRMVQKRCKIAAERHPVFQAGQLICTAVVIKLLLLLFNGEFCLFPAPEILESRAVDKPADHLKSNNINDILRGDRMVRSGQHKNDRDHIDDHVAGKRKGSCDGNQIDDDGNQNIFKEETAVLLRRKESGAGQDHVDAGEPDKQPLQTLLRHRLLVDVSILQCCEKTSVRAKDNQIDNGCIDGRNDKTGRKWSIGSDETDERKDTEHRSCRDAKREIVGIEISEQCPVPL